MSRTVAEPITAPVAMPIQAAERIHIVDILRGFALLGILLVNIQLFANPLQTLGLPPASTSPFIDRAASWLVRFTAEGKFISLFSLLFGLSFTIQITHFTQRGGGFVGLYSRRLLILLAFGLIHAFFIWSGDILILYALLGFLLMPFHKAKPKTLLIWAGILLVLPFLLFSLQLAAIELGRTRPETAQRIDQALTDKRRSLSKSIEQAYRVYPHGSYLEITRQRATDMVFVAAVLPSTAPSVFAMFLIGAYFGRRGIFQNVEKHVSLLRRLLKWGLILGIVGNLIFATLSASISRYEPSPWLFLSLLGLTVGAPSLCLFYIAAITLLARHEVWRKRLALLAPLGRMALTNYLMQSVICTLIFYGYGLGLFGNIGTVAGLLLTIIINVTQILISNLWLQRFRFGPIEWLWRSLTYMSWQPIRR